MKIMFISLGCDKNLVDTENMLGILRDKGFEFTDDDCEADVIVINTCCFINDAKEESINTILEMAQRKNNGKCKALIVSGCLAHRYKDELIKEIPEVDAYLGTSSYDKIAEIILSVLDGKGYNVIDSEDRLVATDNKRIITPGGYYEYLKIAEGCDKHCTYCIIPKVRGNFRSYPYEYILKQANELVDTLKAAGYKVKIDDSDKAPGWKFSGQEILGIPTRIEIGPKDIENNQAVIVRRDTREKIVVSLDELTTKLAEVLETMQNDMFERAKAFLDSHINEATTMDEMNEKFNENLGFIKAMWCGDEACEDEIKAQTGGATSRCIPEEEEHLSDVCVCCGKPAKHMVYWGKAY